MVFFKPLEKKSIFRRIYSSKNRKSILKNVNSSHQCSTSTSRNAKYS